MSAPACGGWVGGLYAGMLLRGGSGFKKYVRSGRRGTLKAYDSVPGGEGV